MNYYVILINYEQTTHCLFYVFAKIHRPGKLFRLLLLIFFIILFHMTIYPCYNMSITLDAAHIKCLQLRDKHKEERKHPRRNQQSNSEYKSETLTPVLSSKLWAMYQLPYFRNYLPLLNWFGRAFTESKESLLCFKHEVAIK